MRIWKSLIYTASATVLSLVAGGVAMADFDQLQKQTLLPGMNILIDPSADGVSRNVSNDMFFLNGQDIRQSLSIQGIWEKPNDDVQGRISLQIGSAGFNGIVDHCATFQEIFCNKTARMASVPGGATWLLGTIGQDLCRSDADYYCIESASRTNLANGETTELSVHSVGELDINIPSESDIPRSARNVMFVDPSKPDLVYEVSANALAMWDRGKLEFHHYSLDITPTLVERGSYSFVTYNQKTSQDRRPYLVKAKSDPTCAWITPGYCGRAIPFEPDTQFAITVRLPQSAGSWFVGRVSNPALEILTPSNPDSNRLKLLGSAVKVPSIFVACDETCFRDLGRDPTKVSSGHSDGRGSGALMLPFISESKDKSLALGQLQSTGYSTLWSLSLFGMNEAVQIDYGTCNSYRSKILGISGSSALLMQSSPPSRVGNELQFRVAGVHLNHIGEVEYGNYSAYVDAGFLACISGQSSAPTSASLSVISGGSGEVVSTRTVGVVGSWVKLEATNITFSEKQIRFSVSGKRLATLTRFSAGKASLSAAHRATVQRSVRNLKAGSITCTANYFVGKDKNLAQSRAKATCDLAKKLNTKLKTKLRAVRTTKGNANQVLINLS